MTKVVAFMSMSLDGYVAANDGVAEVFDFANTPVVLGNPTVVTGVGVTHLRYPVHTSREERI